MALADRLKAAGVKTSGSRNYNYDSSSSYSSKKKKKTYYDESTLAGRLGNAGVERETTPAQSYQQSNRNNYNYQSTNNYTYSQTNRLTNNTDRKSNSNNFMGMLDTWTKGLSNYSSGQDTSDKNRDLLTKQGQQLQNYFKKYGSQYDQDTIDRITSVLKQGNNFLNSQRLGKQGRQDAADYLGAAYNKNQDDTAVISEMNRLNQYVNMDDDAFKKMYQRVQGEYNGKRSKGQEISYGPNNNLYEVLSGDNTPKNESEQEYRLMNRALSIRNSSDRQARDKIYESNIQNLSADDAQKLIDNYNEQKRLLEAYGQTGTAKYRDITEHIESLQNHYYNSTLSNVEGNANSNYIDIFKNGNQSYEDASLRELWHAAINGDQQAREMIDSRNASEGVTGEPQWTYDQRTGQIVEKQRDDFYEPETRGVLNMTDAERKNYNYIYNTQGAEAADEYISSISRDLTARQRELENQRLNDFADQGFGQKALVSAGTVLGAPLAALSAVDTLTRYGMDKYQAYQKAAEDMRNRGNVGYADLNGSIASTMSKYEQGLDPNADAQAWSNWRRDARQHISEHMSSLGSFGYNTLMSIGDNLMNLAASGGSETGTLAIMGAAAFNDSVNQALEQGMDDDRAVGQGLLAGAAEVLTEKIGLDNLFNAKWSGKEAFKSLYKQVLSEGAEEGLSDIMNWTSEGLWDLFSGTDEASWNQKINQYMELGYSEEEAMSMTARDMVKEFTTDVASGAVSGGVMGGGATYYNNVINTAEEKARNEQIGQQIRETLPENSQYRRMTDQQLGAYAVSIETARAEEAEAKELLNEAAAAMQEGKKIDNELATEILENPSAVAMVEEVTNSGDITSKSQVKKALSEYNENVSRRGDVTKFFDENGRLLSSGARDYISNRQSLSAAISDETISKTFGQEGSKLFKDIYKRAVDNGLDSAKAYQSIALAYNAGVTENGQIPSAINLTFGDRMNLYKAGLEDAKNYAAENIANANYRSAVGRLGVDLEDANVKTLMQSPEGRAAVEMVDKVSKALGLRVVYHDQIRGANGYYDKSGKEIHIAADSDPDATFAWVFGHEVTHALQQSAPKEYNTLKRIVADVLGEDFNAEVQNELDKALDAGDSMTQIKAQDEALANYVGTLVRDRNALNDFITKATTVSETVSEEQVEDNRNALQKIRDFLVKILNKLRGIKDESVTREIYSVQSTIDALTDALRAAEKNVAAYNANLENKADNQEAFTAGEELQYSTRERKNIQQNAIQWNENVFKETGKRNVPKNVLTNAGVIMEAMGQILEEPDIAKLLPDETDVLSGTPTENPFTGERSKRTTVFGNDSYGYSVENSTICIRSLAMELLLDRCSELMGHSLSTREAIALSQMAWSMTDQPTCQYCYVFADRMAQRQARDNYIKDRDAALKNVGKIGPKTRIVTEAELITPVEKTNKKGETTISEDKFILDQAIEANPKLEKQLRAYNEFLAGRKNTDNQRARFLMFLNAQKNGTALVTREQVASEQSMVDAVKENPALKEQMADIYKYSNNASHAKAKVQYTAYNNDILKLSDDAIALMNKEYGVRFYSYSDFHPAFILENMQMFTDAAVRGLKGLAYTKDLDYVRIFADTGANINVSLKMIDGTVGEMDGMQGADWEGAKELRDKYPGVGTVMVCTSDEQVEWALAQDWIDMVLPYHTCFSAEVGKAFGWKDFRSFQSDAKIKGMWNEKAGDLKSISPFEHANSKKKYLELCKKNNLTPRFSQWQDNPNYMKLVIETRRAYNKTPALQPKFNLDAAKASINDMKKRGGYNNPFGGSTEEMEGLAQDMVGRLNERFTDLAEREDGWAATREFNRDVLFSRKASEQRDSEYIELAKDPKKNAATLQRMVDAAAREAGYRPSHQYHGSLAYGFTVFDKAKAQVGGNSGAGFYFSNSQDDSDSHYADVEGADNFFKASNLADRIIDAGEWNGVEVDDYDEALKIAKDEINKTPGTYDVYLKYNNPYIRDFRNSTNIYDHIMDSFDESTVDRNDYDSDEDFEDDLVNYRYEHLSEEISAAVYGAYRDLEDNYEIVDSPFVNDIVEAISERAYEYESITWDDIKDAIENAGDVILTNDGWSDSGDGIAEFTRAIIENFGFDAIEDYEVSQKFGQLSREMMDDTVHTIVFSPNQIKPSDPVTYDNDGNAIPLSERFNTRNNDIRYSRKDSEGRELSKGQQSYFAESKIRDAEGNLLQVYHGSPATDINVYDRGRAGQHTGAYSDKAIWFTNNQKFADDFSYEFKPTSSMFQVKRGAKGRVYPSYLNITNPFDLTNPTQEMREMLYKGAAEIYSNPKAEIDRLLEIGNHQLLKHYLDFDEIEAAGYDGIIAKLSVEGDDLEYGIFNSNQAKDINNQNPTRNPDIRYSRISDETLLNRLNNEDTITVYRAMQLIDGKLYPPMAARVAEETGGKRTLVEPTELNVWYQADERPDLIKNGKFTLDKANGSAIEAAYNPYWHTSRSLLNDQFSSAYKRPNLVTVECEVPASELTSGYKAEGAKDAVGEMYWHSGPVSSKLAKLGNPRRVILSRYVKVNRIVSDAEAAKTIAGMLDGTDVKIPDKVVTPSLKKELEKYGVMETRRNAAQIKLDRFSYESLISKPPMRLTPITWIQMSRDDIVDAAVENAASVGYVNEQGNSIVHVDDIDKDILVGRRAVRHGLDRRIKLNGAAALKIGEILKNAIRINELTPDKQNIQDTYVLIGAANNETTNDINIIEFVVDAYTNELEDMVVMHSFNNKEEASTKSAGKNQAPRAASSEITISELLERVNLTFPDVLPEDVLKHFGYKSRPDGKIGEDVLYSRRSSETMTNLVEAAEANYRNQRVQQEFMDAAKEWRNKATALNEAGSNGFSKRMTSLIKEYGDNIEKKDSERIVGKLRDLTRTVMRNPDITYNEISDRAGSIAAEIMWGKKGITENLAYNARCFLVVCKVLSDSFFAPHDFSGYRTSSV